MKRAETVQSRWSAVRQVVLGELALIAAAGWCWSAVAQTSATLQIGGVVLGVSRIVVDPQAGHDSLSLAQGVNSAVVANVTEQSNSATGYDVKLTSLNAQTLGTSTPVLKGAAGATNAIAYSLSYGAPGREASVSLDTQGSASVTQATAKTPAAGAAKNIKVTVPQGAYSPDTYSDTLILTIASK